jgi:hypothetical protein
MGIARVDEGGTAGIEGIPKSFEVGLVGGHEAISLEATGGASGVSR